MTNPHYVSKIFIYCGILSSFYHQNSFPEFYLNLHFVVAVAVVAVAVVAVVVVAVVAVAVANGFEIVPIFVDLKNQRYFSKISETLLSECGFYVLLILCLCICELP